MKTWFSTSRITGLFYLGIVVTGMFSFLFARQALYVDGDATITAANLVEKETLARLGIAAQLALVAFQALTALWFYKLFRMKSNFGAGLIAVFGMVNAVAILLASSMWLSALKVALDGGQANIAYALFSVHDNIWAVASLFFGLWLLPMAYMARQVKVPRALVWFLVAGGVGYILSAFTSLVFPDHTTLTELLPLPATVGEFWMVGYLLRGRFRDKKMNVI